MHKRSLTVRNLQNFSDWLFQLAQGANCVIVPMESIRERRRGAVNHRFSPVRCIVCDESCSEVSNCTSFKVVPRSEKWPFFRKLKLCRLCLKRHSMNRCNLVKPCSINGCTRSHHPLLHNSTKLWVMLTVSNTTSRFTLWSW